MAAFLQDAERPPLRIATDQVENQIDLLSQDLLELPQRHWLDDS